MTSDTEAKVKEQTNAIKRAFQSAADDAVYHFEDRVRHLTDDLYADGRSDGIAHVLDTLHRLLLTDEVCGDAPIDQALRDLRRECS